MILLLALFFFQKASALGPPSVQANQDGIKQYKKENYGEAFKDFAGALSRDSRNPIFHFNIGDAFLKNGEIQKAITEFESIEKSEKAPPDLKFKAMFNAGNAALEQKDIPKALEYYQRALDYKPDSTEVKTNIELALKEEQKGGGGDQNQQQNNKDEQNKKNENQKGQDDKEQQKPKPFQSQALNENDVRRILEELKRQEEQIRAKQNFDNHKAAEKPIDKDW